MAGRTGILGRVSSGPRESLSPPQPPDNAIPQGGALSSAAAGQRVSRTGTFDSSPQTVAPERPLRSPRARHPWRRRNSCVDGTDSLPFPDARQLPGDRYRGDRHQMQATPAAEPAREVSHDLHHNQTPPGTPPGAPIDDPLPELTPTELARRWAADDRPALLDVREVDEHRIAHLPGARLVPLATLPAAVDSLDPAAELVVYCHHGVRSAAAVDFLRRHGIRRARNLTGGIDRWSREVDPGVARY